MLSKALRRYGAALVGGLALLAMGAGQARADIILTLATASTNPAVSPNPAPALGNTGNFTYTYIVSLGPNSLVNPGGIAGNVGQGGNFFTIYDFPGLTTPTPTFTPIAPGASFTVSEQPVGITPVTQVPTDNPALTNVTFTYNGPQITNPSPASGLVLGTVTLTSTLGGTAGAEFYSGASQKADFPNLISNNTSQLVGPLGPGVPEPSTMISGGLIALLFGYGVHRRRKAA